VGQAAPDQGAFQTAALPHLPVVQRFELGGLAHLAHPPPGFLGALERFRAPILALQYDLPLVMQFLPPQEVEGDEHRVLAVAHRI
jgi:hypothetical protein